MKVISISFFGVLVSSFVEVSIGGKSLCRLGASEVVREMALLHPSDSKRYPTVLTLELSSGEVQDRFQKALFAKLLGRLRAVNQALAKLGQSAVRGSSAACDIELAPP